jgi:hypothetical protein
MRKLIIAAAAVIGTGVVLKLVAPKLPSVDWETRFARMPDDAPPKWMFRNITEIRDNTARIIELLEPRPSDLTAASTVEGPPEVIDAARQELEYPGDDTNEG